jgi:hypothetical protein
MDRRRLPRLTRYSQRNTGREEQGSMPVTDIKEIRLLPPLAIGRFGGSPEPMDNYDAIVGDPADYRRLVPAETLVVDLNSGEVVHSQVPAALRFRDGAGLIRPVCPFLEVWARYEDNGDLLPLTLIELGELGLSPAALSWTVSVANLKMLRRTGDPGDRVSAEVSGVTDHARRPLDARAVSFKTDRTVRLGWAHYIKPTAAFPQVRFRFTPGIGQVFGARPDGVITAQNDVYDGTRGTWDTYTDDAPPANPADPRARFSTMPSFIYGQNRATGENLGYFDDSCDGIVTVTLARAGGPSLTTFARISAGPPDFAPDSFPVRTMGDELEQLALGPAVDAVTAEEVTDIVRRAQETLRLMDPAHENARYAGNVFSSTEAAYRTVYSIHTSLLANLSVGLAAPASSPERRASHASLTRIDQILRDFGQVGDRSTSGRRKMPALMRGADALDLALNRRQRSKIRKAVEVFAPATETGSPQVVAMWRMIRSFQPVAMLHAAFSEDGRSLADRFADPDEVLEYLRIAVAKGSVATTAGLAGQPLVLPGDVGGSAMPALVRRAEHPMNGPLSGYRDQDTGRSGIDVLEDWIASLEEA